MAYQGSITLVDLSDGSSGSSGINTATVYLYQRAINTPSGPNDTLTYNFSTHSLNGSTAAFNGWKSSIGNLSGDNPIWIIAATATASADAENDNILINEWSNPIKMAQDGQDGQQGPPGQDGTPGTPGQDGAPGLNGINTATVYIYKRTASALDASDTPDDVTYTFEDGSFIPPSDWNKQVPTTDGNPCYVSSAVAIGNGATATLEWSTPVILAEDGEQGAQGASVIAERELYYLKTNSSVVPQISNSSQITSTDRQNGWTSIVPTYVNNGDYYTCIETTLDDDGTTTTLWSTPILNRGLTNANANAASALIQAGEASTATSLLGGHFIYRANGTQSTPESANVVQTVRKNGIDVTNNPGQWGYNVHIGSNGIRLRNNEITLSEWTSTALNFYNPSTHEANATLSADGLMVSKGGITAGTSNNNQFIYISTEDYPLRQFQLTQDITLDPEKTYYIIDGNNRYAEVEEPDIADINTYYEIEVPGVTINGYTPTQGGIPALNNPAWREIVGTNFGIDSTGTLYANNAQISGTIMVDANSNVYTTDIIDQFTDSIDEAVGISDWLSLKKFRLTEDVEIISGKNYYEHLWEYVLTEDSEIDPTKTYYIRTGGEGTEENPYIYSEVENPTIENIGNYYEISEEYSIVSNPNVQDIANYYELVEKKNITNYLNSHLVLSEQGLDVIAYEEGLHDKNAFYRINITYDGVYIYDTEGMVSKFGRDIDFTSSKPQHIGGQDTYIQFNPETWDYLLTEDDSIVEGKIYYIRTGGSGTEENPYTYSEVENPTIENKENYYEYQVVIPESLNIAANNVILGGKNTIEEITSLNKDLTDTKTDIGAQQKIINEQGKLLEGYQGYINIEPDNSSIKLGKAQSSSFVEINGNDLKVAINMDGNDVAYMSGEPARFYAPSAVITNLYMQTSLNGDNPIGAIGWVMRSNGHLSLKRIK